MQIQLFSDGKVRWEKFSREVIDLIKEIPSNLRTYDADSKTWTIDPSEHVAFAQKATQAGHQVSMPVTATEPPKAPWVSLPPRPPENPLERRLDTLEQALEDIAGRLDLLHSQVSDMSALLQPGLLTWVR